MPVCHWYATAGGMPAHQSFATSTMIRIPLCNTDGCHALADDSDNFLLNWKWTVHPSGYAQTYFGRTRVFMHSMLIAVPGGCVADHRNRDRTDNRRENLRFASSRENAANRSRRRNSNEQFVGVRRTASGKWQARVGERGRHVGIFETAEDAARARDDAAREEFGDFATLNFSPDIERAVNTRPLLAVPRRDGAPKLGDSEREAAANSKDTASPRTRRRTRARADRVKPSKRSK